MFEDDLDDIIEPTQVQQQTTIPDDDEIMADTHAMEEEAELEAMLSTYETQSPALEPQRPESPSLSDDEYDGLFMDLILQSGNQHQRSAEDLVLSGQMDMS